MNSSRYTTAKWMPGNINKQQKVIDENTGRHLNTIPVTGYSIGKIIPYRQMDTVLVMKYIPVEKK